MGITPAPELRHRSDIDGLRAFAVLSVIFFHFGLLGMPGGFVGVDVFFVISGYLITSIISRSLNDGTFSLIIFYERRIRRIIPALAGMLLVTSLAAFLFFPPKELSEFGLSASATAAFLSNIYFASQTGYFAAAENLMPLLHTWSLGIEEQFYIAWPLILMACQRTGLRLLMPALPLLLGALSLAYSEWAINSGKPVDAFYMPQSRVWELMLGAVLAFRLVPLLTFNLLRQILAFLGLGLIIFAVTQFSAHTPFPGLWATVPCGGAFLLLYTGRDGQTFVSRLLSMRPVAFIGLISYSLYLWHWPLLVFVQNYLGRPLSVGECCSLVVASMALATLSWRYIERPFRVGVGIPLFSREACFSAGLGTLILSAGFGAAMYLGDGLKWRLGPEILSFYVAGHNINPLTDNCDTEGPAPPPIELCTRPAISRGQPYDVLVWGDSHADALFPAIETIANSKGLVAREAAKSGCPPLLDVERVDGRPGRVKPRGCTEFNRAMLQDIQTGPKPSLVVLVARWSLYTETTKDLRGDRHAFLVDEKSQTLDAETSKQVLTRALGHTLDALQSLGLKVLLIGQAPEYPQDPNVCFVTRAMSRRDVSYCISQPEENAENRLRSSKEILREVTADRPVTLIDLDDVLCEKHTCWASKDHRALYEDEHHLNVTGASLVAARLDKKILHDLFVERGYSGPANLPRELPRNETDPHR